MKNKVLYNEDVDTLGGECEARAHKNIQYQDYWITNHKTTSKNIQKSNII